MHGGKEPISAFLIRMKNILIRPRDEWRAIKDEPKTYSAVIFHYVAIFAAIPPAAAIIDGIIFGGPVSKNAIFPFLGYLLLPNLLWYGVSIINVVITGAIITAVVTAAESRWCGLEGLK